MRFRKPPGKPSELLRITETFRDSSPVPITHKTKTALQLRKLACDGVRHFTRIQLVLFPVPTYNFTACVVIGVDVASAQTALAKLNLRIALSCLQSSSKTGNFTNSSFIAFSETTFYSYSDFCNNLISSSLSSAKIEDCDVIGRAFEDCLELTWITRPLPTWRMKMASFYHIFCTKLGDCNLISNALNFLKHTGDISHVIYFHVTDLRRIVN